LNIWKKITILAIMVLTLLVPTAVMADTSDSVDLGANVLTQISISVDQTALNFGDVRVGVQSAWSAEIRIDNTGTDSFTVSPSFTGINPTFYNSCLIFQEWDGAAWKTQVYARDWAVVVPSGGHVIIQACVYPLVGYAGSQTATLAFMATP
jgi:hypothetical protein